ncbi:dynein beta chain, ciliary-like [Lycorma delicatula]|uniref:dynein beta chain, ciliary-like n=1 Tax=Lycorma delicatula TaxID=130591 RepID=UPI003F51397B
MEDTVDEDPVESDPRLLFFYTYLSKTIKFKVDKWQKMMGNEEFKNIIMSFLDDPSNNVLIIRMTSAGVLMPSLSFPSVGRSKASYFIRKYPEPITPENYQKLLIYGDIAPKPVDELAVLVEEVFLPLLSNPGNHKYWPSVVVTDVKNHVNNLRSIVYKVRGEINGQTLLPMPEGIDRVFKVEESLISSRGEDCDLQLKSAIEGAVIKWAKQVNEVIRQQSSQVFEAGGHPIPVAGVREAREIDRFLKPLKKRIEAIESTDFDEIAKLLPPMLHVLCLTWVHCKYYCSSTKVITILKEICNLLIEQANKYLDPSSIFQGDIDEMIPRLKTVITVLKDFKYALFCSLVKIREDYNSHGGSCHHSDISSNLLGDQPLDSTSAGLSEDLM